jgi:hypothetical protein
MDFGMLRDVIENMYIIRLTPKWTALDSWTTSASNSPSSSNSIMDSHRLHLLGFASFVQCLRQLDQAVTLD